MGVITADSREKDLAIAKPHFRFAENDFHIVYFV